MCDEIRFLPLFSLKRFKFDTKMALLLSYLKLAKERAETYPVTIQMGTATT